MRQAQEVPLKGFFALLFVLSAALTGCSSSENSSRSSPPAGKTDGPNPSHRLADRLLFSKTGYCGSGNLAFHFLSMKSFVIGENQAGQDIMVDLDLFLRANGTYEAQYHEMDITQYIPDGFAYKKIRERIVRGRWESTVDNIILSDLATLNPVSYNDAEALLVSFSHNILSSGLNGREGLLRRVSNIHGDKSYREYCPTGANILGSLERFVARSDRAQVSLASLKAAVPDNNAGGRNYISIEVFIFPEGRTKVAYSFISTPGKPPVIEDGVWEVADGKLNLAYGAMSIQNTHDTPILTFNKDFKIYDGLGRPIEVNLAGSAVQMWFSPSELTMDDL